MTKIQSLSKMSIPHVHNMVHFDYCNVGLALVA